MEQNDNKNIQGHLPVQKKKTTQALLVKLSLILALAMIIFSVIIHSVKWPKSVITGHWHRLNNEHNVDFYISGKAAWVIEDGGLPVQFRYVIAEADKKNRTFSLCLIDKNENELTTKLQFSRDGLELMKYPAVDNEQSKLTRIDNAKIPPEESFVNLPLNEWGSTHLSVAAEVGSPEEIERLIQQGAIINGTDKYGFTALHGAAKEGKIENLKILLKKGAEVNVSSNLGITPLHLAARDGRLEAVILLLENGADVNARDEDGSTSLHYAAGKEHIDIVDVLLEKGADPEIQEKDGDTPLDIAKKYSASDFISLMESSIESKKK